MKICVPHPGKGTSMNASKNLSDFRKAGSLFDIMIGQGNGSRVLNMITNDPICRLAIDNLSDDAYFVHAFSTFTALELKTKYFERDSYPFPTLRKISSLHLGNALSELEFLQIVRRHYLGDGLLVWEILKPLAHLSIYWADFQNNNFWENRVFHGGPSEQFCIS